MTPTPEDNKNTSLCLWREARGEGALGMIAVGCVIRNRVARRHTSFSIEVMRPRQFTSMSVPTDSQYRLQPKDTDATWKHAQQIADAIIDGKLIDSTYGATLYWNPDGLAESEKSSEKFLLHDGSLVDFPNTWDRTKVRETAHIGKHIFLKEQ